MLFTDKLPKSVCVLRLSAIGDVCHMVAVVQMLQRHWPGVAITWVIGKVEASLLKGLPGIEFIIFDKSQGIKAYYNLYQVMQNRSFDVLLHTQLAFRASLVSLCIPAKIRLGFAWKQARDFQWMFTNAKILNKSRQHVIEGFLVFLEKLGIFDRELSWKIPLEEEDKQWARKIIQGDKSALIINPAASNPIRNWKSSGYIAVAQHALEQGMQVVLTGGPTQAELILGKEICQNISGNIENLIGKTTLKQLLALLELATVVVAPDTGPAHMATAVGKPVIGLYACSNPLRTGPYHSLDYLVNRYPDALQKFTGKKINEVRWGKRVNHPAAMSLITEEEVIAQIDKVLQSIRVKSVVNTTSREDTDLLLV